MSRTPQNMDEGKNAPDRHGPPTPTGPRGPDPRLLGLVAIVVVVVLAVVLAHVVSSVDHADLCLASGGRGC
jgi:hypothetical protein